MKNLICIFLFLISFRQNAQNSVKAASDNKYKVNVMTDRTVQVEFAVDKDIYNTVVLLTDNAGNTIFMDSQYKFKGVYKHTIDLSKSPRGNYYLKILNDKEVVNKSLSLE